MKARATSLLVALGLAAAPLPAQAQVQQVTVEIDGLACPFCAYGLEKRLKNVDGVRQITIDIEGGRAILVPRDGASVDVAGVPDAVKRAGFTPRTMRVRALGRIRGGAAQALFVSAGGGALFRLAANGIFEAALRGRDSLVEVSGTATVPIKKRGREMDLLPELTLTSVLPSFDEEGEN